MDVVRLAASVSNAPRLGFVDAVSKRSYKLPTEGVFSGLLFGMSLGIVWLPCTGAVLGAILTWVAARGNVLTGGLLLMVYSLGFAVPMLAVAYSTKVSSTLVAKTANTIWIKRAAGLVLLIVGVYLINQRFFLFRLRRLARHTDARRSGTFSGGTESA